MATVLSTHPLHPKAAGMLAGKAELVVASALDAETLSREARDAEIIIVRAPLPAALFDGAQHLRAAIRHGAGLDMIPVEAATLAGVLVANVPAVNARSVAEHVFLVSLSLLRRSRIMDRDLRAHGWLVGREHSLQANEIAGKTLGIVGMGNIGREVARIAIHGFGLDVVANSRSPHSFPQGVGFLELDALMERSDIVVLCCPLTPETTGLIDAGRIARMKPGAILVNVSRGAVVDDEALISALAGGRIGGAALDVFTTQPLTPDHPYFSFENVIVTPHQAGITEESMMRMGVGAAGEALRVLDNLLPVNFRNPEVLARYRQRFPE